MSAPLRLGLVGCGRAAERLWLPAILAVPEVHLVATVDPREDRRMLLAGGLPGCRTVDRLEELALDRDVDALILTTPPETHFELARRILEARCPLLIEKPLAATVPEAVTLDQLRCATGIALMVGFNRRWWAPARRLRERLLRRPGACRLELVFVTRAAEWGAVAGMPELLDDLGTHQLDLLRFLLDREIQTVGAQQTRTGDIQMDVTLNDGSSALCRVGHHGGSVESIRVAAGPLDAWIHARSDRLTPARGSLRAVLDVADRALRKVTGRRSSMRRSFEDELRAFAQSVRAGTDPTPGAPDGVAAARAVAAARRSLASGGAPVSP